MKNRIQFLITLVLIAIRPVEVLGQATQPCIVKQYNQKEEKTPLADVEVWVSNAGSNKSAADGTLTLIFRTQKPGDKVEKVRATKAGYVLFNTEAVEQWFISRDQRPFTLVMVKKDYFDKLKEQLTQASKDNYKAKYEQAVRELESERQKNKVTEDEFNKRYEELEEYYNNQLKNVDSYVDQFARIDLSEISKQEDQCIKLAREGFLDEAVEAYNRLDAVGKFVSSVDNSRKLNEDINKLKAENRRQQEAAANFFEVIKRQVNTLELSGRRKDINEARDILKRVALTDTTFTKAVLKYANFSKKHYDYDEAIIFYKIALNNTENQNLQAAIMIRLGELYSMDKNLDFHQSESYLSKAIELYTDLYQKNSDDLFKKYVVKAYELLGELYEKTRRPDLLERSLQKALLVLKDLPDSRHWMGNIYMKLAKHYIQTGDYTKAEEFGLIGHEYKYDLSPISSVPNEEYLINRYERLGDFYKDIKFFVSYKIDERAADYYIKACELIKSYYSQLEKKNDEIEPILCQGARIKYKIGNLEIENERAAVYLREALNDYVVLFKQSPETYRRDLLWTILSLRDNYGRDYDRSIELCLSMLPIYSNTLSSADSEKFRNEMARLQEELGNCFYGKEDYSKAVEYYTAALESIEFLQEHGLNDYFSPYIRSITAEGIYENLGWSYLKLSEDTIGEKYLLKFHEWRQGWPPLSPDDIAEKEMRLAYIYGHYAYDRRKCMEHLLKAKTIYLNLFKKSPDQYRSDLANVNYKLGDEAYSFFNDYNAAEQYFLEALHYYETLVTQNSDLYLEGLTKTQYSLTSVYNALFPNFDTEKVDRLINFLPSLYQNLKQLIDRGSNYYKGDLYYTCRDLCGVYLAKGRADEAIKLSVTEKLEDEDEYFYLAKGYKLLADFYCNESNYQKALEAIDQAISLQPHNVEYVIRKCEVYIQIEDFDHAIENYWIAKEINPNADMQHVAEYVQKKFTQEDWVRLSVIHYKAAALESSNLYDALKEIDKAISVQTGNAELYSIKGDILMRLGYDKDALKMWITIMELNPAFLEERGGTTPLYEELEKRRLFQQQDIILPIQAEVQCELAEKIKDDNSAVERYYLRALRSYTELYSGSPEEYFSNLALIYCKLGDYYLERHSYKESLEFYLQAQDIYTSWYNKLDETERLNLAFALDILGMLYYDREEYNKSEEYYNKAVENYSFLLSLNPNSLQSRTYLANVQYTLGLVYDNLGKHNKSEEFYIKAVENYSFLFAKNPYQQINNVFVCFWLAMSQQKLGDLYFEQGEYGKSRDFYISALKNYNFEANMNDDLDYSNHYHVAILYRNLAYISTKSGEIESALFSIEYAIDLMPNEANYYDTKGEILLMKGDEQEALKMWNKVMELDPDFLSKYDGGTPLYNELKKRGLIE